MTELRECVGHTCTALFLESYFLNLFQNMLQQDGISVWVLTHPQSIQNKLTEFKCCMDCENTIFLCVWLLRYLTGNLYFIQYLLYFQFVIFLLVGDGVCSPWLHQESLVTTFLWILSGIPVTNRITLQSWRGAGTGKFKGKNVANAIKVMHYAWHQHYQARKGGGGGVEAVELIIYPQWRIYGGV